MERRYLIIAAVVIMAVIAVAISGSNNVDDGIQSCVYVVGSQCLIKRLHEESHLIFFPCIYKCLESTAKLLRVVKMCIG